MTYATHSPYFVEAQRFHQIRRLTRVRPDLTKPSKILVHSTDPAKVTTALDTFVRPEVIRNQLDSLLLSNLSEALFANAVGLVEGTTDKAVIEGVACRNGGKPLATNGVVIAAQSGKTSLIFPYEILKGLGIPVFVLFDTIMSGALLSEATANENLLRYLGAKVESWPAAQIYSNYGVLDDNLESVLSTGWPEWTQSVATLVSLGIGDPLKNKVLYGQATRDAEGTHPAVLDEIVSALRVLS